VSAEAALGGQPHVHEGRRILRRWRHRTVDGGEKEVSVDGGSTALSLTNITAGYDNIEVLHGVSVDVGRGSVLALLGPNGAGKTTLLRAASGVLEPTGGVVRLHGEPVKFKSGADAIARGLCLVPEERGIFPNLTVWENLMMWTYGGKGLRLGEIADTAFSRFPILAERRRLRAGSLSGGEQQMLAMSRALSVRPSVLLFDELSMGLSPLIVEELYGVVRELANSGISVVVVEQFADAALRIASEAAILVNGQIVAKGTPDMVRGELAEQYLSG
jgi:branched-chain amino acid transport system ATP-binding protein